MSILDHFTGTPRDTQVSVLEQVAKCWHQTDVVIIRAPVGAGKSRIAHCLGSWAGGASICTPDNALVQQYLDTWPGLGHVHRKGRYTREADYQAALASLRSESVKVFNYMSYLAHRRNGAYAPTVVFDEAHRLIPTLQDMEAVRLWPHINPELHGVRDLLDLMAWAEQAQERSDATGKLAGRVFKLLNTKAQDYVVESEWTEYRGRERECLRVRPLTPRNNRPVFWPKGRVKKLVFMSATFDAEDLYDLGLDGRRIKVIDSPSPIPAEAAPVVYDPVGSMSYRNRASTIPKLVEWLEARLQQHQGQRGFWHATYAVARELRKTRLGQDPRIRWHARDTRLSAFRRWLNDGSEDSVFVGCGLTEGIDLAYDRARWQVVTNVAFPSKADTAVAAKLQHRPRWYSWCAVRDLLQAAGRVGRAADDYGVTYLPASEFGRLYSRNQDMFPRYFNERLRFR